MLPRHQAEPGRHMPPILELRTIPDGGNNRRGQLRIRYFHALKMRLFLLQEERIERSSGKCRLRNIGLLFGK
jgi:hypothetical protein